MVKYCYEICGGFLMKTLKKLDVVIIVILLLASFIPNIIFHQKNNKNYASIYAEIKINGDIYETIDLSGNSQYSFEIITNNNKNTINVNKNIISISDANCKDHLCVKQGEAFSVGDSIVCLPHKLIIEIKGDNESNSSSNDMILSH